MLVVWDVNSGKVVCGKNIGHEKGNQVKFLNNYDTKMIIISDMRMRIWEADYNLKKLEF